MLTTLEEARRRGATIVVINPLREAGNTRFAHPQDPADVVGRRHPAVEPALAGAHQRRRGRLQGAHEDDARARSRGAGRSVVDHVFVEENTTGYDALVASLAEIGWEEIERESGVARELLERAGNIAADSKNTIVCWSMGLTQHKNGVANIREAVNLLLLGGNFGSPRRRRLPGARTQQCTGRSQHGRVGEDARRVPRCARA